LFFHGRRQASRRSRGEAGNSTDERSAVPLSFPPLPQQVQPYARDKLANVVATFWETTQSRHPELDQQEQPIQYETNGTSHL
jgi:hypothetical protein